MGISTYRENLSGTHTLNELHQLQTTDRAEYKGRPQVFYQGLAYGIDGTPRSSPVQLGGSSFNPISGQLGMYNNTHALFFIDEEGNGHCYGSNSNNWLGLSGVVGNQLDGKWSKIKPGGHQFAFGMKSDSDSRPFTPNGTLWGWGFNNVGQLGLGDVTGRASPTQLPGNWKDFFPYRHSSGPLAGETSNAASPNMFALTTNDQLWAWGVNYFGMLGQNNAINRSSPIQIPGTWFEFQRTDNACYGVRNDGSLWSWGNNNYGQLGHNSTLPRSSPVQIWDSNSRTKYIVETNNALWSMAVKEDGSLWAWGYNNYGQLGQGDTINRSSPVMIPGAWENFIVKDDTVLCFAQGSDKIWGWGRNDTYQLGPQVGNSRVSRPVEIDGEYDRRYGIWFNGQTAMAVKKSYTEDFGGIWGWGRNDYGQLSMNNRTTIPAPQRLSFYPENIYPLNLSEQPAGFNSNYSFQSYITRRL